MSQGHATRSSRAPLLVSLGGCMNWKHWLGVAGIAIVAIAVIVRVPGIGPLVIPPTSTK